MKSDWVKDNPILIGALLLKILTLTNNAINFKQFSFFTFFLLKCLFCIFPCSLDWTRFWTLLPKWLRTRVVDPEEWSGSVRKTGFGSDNSNYFWLTQYKTIKQEIKVSLSFILLTWIILFHICNMHVCTLYIRNNIFFIIYNIYKIYIYIYIILYRTLFINC